MIRKLLLPGAVPALLLFAACASSSNAPEQSAAAAEPARTETAAGAVHDAYLKGRIVGDILLDRHVSVFDVKVEVKDGVATLSGAVDNDVDRALAVEIARGVDGVREVKSDLDVKAGTRAEAEKRQRQSLGQALDDTAITTQIKARLLANMDGIHVHVKTVAGAVTLTGKVGSDEERDLAGRIAHNTQGVTEVANRLTIGERTASR